MVRSSCLLIVLGALGSATVAAAAVPPAPSGEHPRLFMDSARLPTYQANASIKGTAAQAMVARCQETIDQPKYYTDRGGADGAPEW